MLRRLIDGVLLAVLAWFVATRLDAGQVVLGVALAAVIVLTGWRVHRLWRKYQRLLHELAAAEAAKLSDDPAERERAERILRQRRMMHAADMTVWTGFVLGAAAVTPGHASGMGADMAGNYDGVGSDLGGGGFAGGDMGGGGFGGGEG